GSGPVGRDLYARLKRLKEYKHSDQRSQDLEKSAQEELAGGVAIPDALADWSSVAPLVLTRQTRVSVPGPGGAALESRLLSRRVAFRELCFMDTETTGLSGGAGTTVFLVGSAHYGDGVVTVQQTLLGDFPGEPEFLEIVHDQLWQSAVWVSYNGKAFDSRLLETRFLLNGRHVTVPEQLDLLYWSRRLWRRIIGGCPLDDIEREILRVSRVNDISGLEIPDRYFGFLRAGDATRLLPVFAHHLEDIVSLVRLFLHLEETLGLIARSGTQTDVLRLDRAGLGKYLVLRGAAGGEALLRDVVVGPGPGESMDDRERAATALSQALRRDGRGAETAQLWERLWAEGSLRAGIERAKYLEHRAGNPREAADIVGTLLHRSTDERTHDQLTYRLARLRRKLGS
ncbi:MAG: ribonuclease H-like domain-containing protein, partial [Spirochaetaceae bacterium]|nr:ribonuclease H-like domain-containing protein [Spirochaetaceae bacterium]